MATPTTNYGFSKPASTDTTVVRTVYNAGLDAIDTALKTVADARVTTDADPGYVGTPIGWISGTAALVAANRCDYYEVPPPLKTRTITTAWWFCSTSAAINLCMGLYNADTGARLCTTGSFASPGTGLRSQALAASVEITAGTRLVVGLSADGTGASFYQASGFVAAFMEPAGLRKGGNVTSGQFPLPSTLPALGAGVGRAFGVMFT